MSKTVGYGNPMKWWSLSIGTREDYNEYTWTVLHLHGASWEGSPESCRRKPLQRNVSCTSLCQGLGFGSFNCLCMHALFCCKRGLCNTCNIGKSFTEVSEGKVDNCINIDPWRYVKKQLPTAFHVKKTPTEICVALKDSADSPYKGLHIIQF